MYRLPVEPSTERVPDGLSVHRTFQWWVELGILDRIRAAMVEKCKDLVETTGRGRRSDRRDPFWGRPCRLNPTDRAENGEKRSLLVEANGGPLAVVVGAKVRDDKLPAITLDAIVVEPTLG